MRVKCTHVMGMLTEKLTNRIPRFNRFLFFDPTSRAETLCLFAYSINVHSDFSQKVTHRQAP